MFTAFRREMGESNRGLGLKPNGHIYGLTKESIDKMVSDARKEASVFDWPELMGQLEVVEITPEFNEFLALNNGDAYWTTIGKHRGDLGVAILDSKQEA